MNCVVVTSRRAAAGRVLGAMALCAALVTGCSDANVEGEYPTGLPSGQTQGNPYAQRDSIFGEGGLGYDFSGGGRGDAPGDGGGGGIGVNSFLWRASLDTIAFMPVNSADPFGGVIITDWYTPPETPDERFKMNVYILGRSLRADGVKVAVFRQVDEGNGGWRDAPLPSETATKIEDAILSKARQLRFEVRQE